MCHLCFFHVKTRYKIEIHIKILKSAMMYSSPINTCGKLKSLGIYKSNSASYFYFTFINIHVK